MTEATISLGEPQLALSVFGVRDQHLRAIRNSLGVAITHRDGEIHVAGDDRAVAKATKALEELKQLAERRGPLAVDDVRQILAQVSGANGVAAPQPAIEVPNASRQIRPRTAGQARYVAAIRSHELVFAVGPAGTGKTYLAVAMAVECLRRRDIRRIVLVRPAVEAGESLGYLPGDLQAKINPYLRPLLDALHEMMDYELIKSHMERDVIEVVPLAYMRGRTLNEAFVILDEAQNTTVAQMKMFLTRMGEGSRMVVSGDVTQVDLPSTTRSGLVDAVRRLQGLRGVSIVELDESDIVRHRLVQEIVQAYEEKPRRRSPKARR
ncbi:MAG: PhoH family protein [Pirellulaceae bacterium]|jgi:phosphate starvation-inducible PhoH-like protein|nr:PhoH family protein [Pirellulaceae bacterium]